MRNVLIAADLPVRLPLGGDIVQITMELTAKEWANRLGLGWDTVRQRRYRGDSLTDAFQPSLRRTPFNKSDFQPVKPKTTKPKNISGAIQMATLEIKVPAVAHVVVTGVTEGAKAQVMRRIQEVLRDEFDAVAQTTLPDTVDTAGSDSEIKSALWVVSGA